MRTTNHSMDTSSDSAPLLHQLPSNAKNLHFWPFFGPLWCTNGKDSEDAAIERNVLLILDKKSSNQTISWIHSLGPHPWT